MPLAQGGLLDVGPLDIGHRLDIGHWTLDIPAVLGNTPYGACRECLDKRRLGTLAAASLLALAYPTQPLLEYRHTQRMVHRYGESLN